VRLVCGIYQIFKELGDGNKLFNDIAEFEDQFEDLYNGAAVVPIECCGERVGIEDCHF
jgi:hypothetical protein